MIKRIFDLTAASIGLVLLAPVLALIALAVKLSDPGPALFVQTRVGRRGRPFRMFKFRSMRVNAGGPEVTAGGDPRVTAVGKILRRYKLDEFPQLMNVVLGQMSLVGPRPEVELFVNAYGEAERPVLELKPGITDPASFAFFDEESVLARAADPHAFYVTRLMPAKIRLNLAYARRRSLARDLFLIIATILRPLGVEFDVLRHLGLERPPEASC